MNARAARIIQPDYRCTNLHRLIHNLTDFFGMRLAERAAKDCEILAEDKYKPPIHRAVASHHAITRYDVFCHSEIAAAMLNEHVIFLERSAIEQQFQSFARRQLAFFMLCGDTFLSATLARGCPFFL